MPEVLVHVHEHEAARLHGGEQEVPVRQQRGRGVLQRAGLPDQIW